jgi:hypothetical protein
MESIKIVKFYFHGYCLLQFLGVLYIILQSFLELQKKCLRQQPKTVKVTFHLAVTSCPVTPEIFASTGNAAVLSDAAGVKVCPI